MLQEFWETTSGDYVDGGGLVVIEGTFCCDKNVN